MTEENEKRFYGSEAIFVYDKDNKKNLPVRGVHHNVIKLWPLYPEFLRNAFIEVFSKNALETPQQRWMESDWQKIIIELRNCLVKSDSGEEKFIDKNEACFSIETSNDGIILLSLNKQVYIGKSSAPVAQVFALKNEPDKMLLKNISSNKWTVERPGRKLKEVNVNEYMPVKAGLKISFNPREKGTIINN